MRKILLIAMTLVLLFAGTAFAQSYKDGIYFAEDEAFGRDGWKNQAVVEVSGGKIVSAKYNGVNVLSLPDKKTAAKQRKYVIKSKDGQWDAQSARAEEALVKIGDPSKIAVKSDGTTDAIPKCSIAVKPFLDLASKALSGSPVEKGIYSKDGWYFGKWKTPDATNYFATAIITVVNGRIVSAVSNADNKAGGPTKYVSSFTGKYGMQAKEGEWHVQADRMAQALVKVQDPTKIALKSNGTTDAISGVSIFVSDFFKVAAEALKGAK